MARVRGSVRASTRSRAAAASVVVVVLVSGGAVVAAVNVEVVALVTLATEVVLDFAVVLDVAVAVVVRLPDNAATPPSTANTATITTAERPLPPPVAMTTSLPVVAVLSAERNSRSGASNGLPHALQNAPEPPCTSPHEKHERRRTTLRL